MRAVTFQSMVRIVVAGLVLAHLGERHAAALEDRVVLAGQRVRHRLRVTISMLPDPPQQLAVEHRRGRAAATALRRARDTLAMTVSGVTLLGLGLVGEEHAVAQHVERRSP